MLFLLKISPGCQDTDDVHHEPGLHHVSRLQVAGAVADGVRASGHREHEGVTHADLRHGEDGEMRQSRMSPTAQVIIRYSGLVQSERDILDRIGTCKAHHAVSH